MDQSSASPAARFRGWSALRIRGFNEGMNARRLGRPLTRRVIVGIDEYAQGFRAGYFERREQARRDGDNGMLQARVMAFVVAGADGLCLYPLAGGRPRPSPPFAEGRRVVDFVLSNLVLSQIMPIFVLAQHDARALIDHVDDAWADWARREKPAISVLLPAETGGPGPYAGTADALRRNIGIVQRLRPDAVAVFAAEHVCRMDVRQMVSFHERRAADVTIAAVPVPRARALSSGVLRAGDQDELLAYGTQPARAMPQLAGRTSELAPMGNYLFRPDALIALLEEASCPGGTDFGRHVLESVTCRCRAFVYDFSTNVVPGIKPWEERGYWRDITSQVACESAQRDVRGPLPRLDLDNPDWPIRRSPKRLRRPHVPVPAERGRERAYGSRDGAAPGHPAPRSNRFGA